MSQAFKYARPGIKGQEIKTVCIAKLTLVFFILRNQSRIGSTRREDWRRDFAIVHHELDDKSNDLKPPRVMETEAEAESVMKYRRSLISPFARESMVPFSQRLTRY
jgi:hypothetical protein